MQAIELYPEGFRLIHGHYDTAPLFEVFALTKVKIFDMPQWKLSKSRWQMMSSAVIGYSKSPLKIES